MNETRHQLENTIPPRIGIDNSNWTEQPAPWLCLPLTTGLATHFE